MSCDDATEVAYLVLLLAGGDPSAQLAQLNVCNICIIVSDQHHNADNGSSGIGGRWSASGARDGPKR